MSSRESPAGWRESLRASLKQVAETMFSKYPGLSTEEPSASTEETSASTEELSDENLVELNAIIHPINRISSVQYYSTLDAKEEEAEAKEQEIRKDTKGELETLRRKADERLSTLTETVQTLQTLQQKKRQLQEQIPPDSDIQDVYVKQLNTEITKLQKQQKLEKEKIKQIEKEIEQIEEKIENREKEIKKEIEKEIKKIKGEWNTVSIFDNNNKDKYREFPARVYASCMNITLESGRSFEFFLGILKEPLNEIFKILIQYINSHDQLVSIILSNFKAKNESDDNQQITNIMSDLRVLSQKLSTYIPRADGTRIKREFERHLIKQNGEVPTKIEVILGQQITELRLIPGTGLLSFFDQQTVLRGGYTGSSNIRRRLKKKQTK